MQVEDQHLTERVPIQLVKDFTAEHAHDEAEFYMGMLAEIQETFEGIVQHLKMLFSLDGP